MAIAYRSGDIPNIERVTVAATDGTTAEWLGTEILEVNLKTIARIDADPHPIALAMGGYSLEQSVNELATVTYGRSRSAPIWEPKCIDHDSIIDAMVQSGHPLDDDTAAALIDACRLVDAGGPFYDDNDDDDDD